MKKNKALKALLLVCVLALAVGLAACTSQFVGTWKISSLSIGGTTMNAKTLKKELGSDPGTIEIKEDGKVKVTLLGESGSGTWTEKDDKITLKVKGSGMSEADQLTGEMKDDKLVIKASEGEESIKVTLTKEE
ncbi:MAG: lipocalin family protein [Anaerovoracaceae bacterium]|jgi:hypothetical protein